MGLVGGNVLHTDSTHIKAKANKHKKKLVTVEEAPKAYLEELDHFPWEDDDIAASEKIRLFRFLFDFWTMRTRLQEGSITPEQYDEWKLCWPDGHSQ